MDALHRGDVDGAEQSVDPARWREEFVGFTSAGVIEWPQWRASMERVWQSSPNLEFDVTARHPARARITGAYGHTSCRAADGCRTRAAPCRDTWLERAGASQVLRSLAAAAARIGPN